MELTVILATAKSGTQGRNTSVHSSSREGWNLFAEIGSQVYLNISINVGTSFNLGVNPARTTLSEHAIHSTQSINIVSDYKHVYHLYPRDDTIQNIKC